MHDGRDRNIHGRVPTASDPCLAPLREAVDDAARDTAIAALVARAQPLIEAITGRYRSFLSRETLDDVRSVVVLRLVRRLRDVADGNDAAIVRFDDFVATVAFNCVNDALRERAPARTQLKDRIRHAVAHSKRVASWHAANVVTVGFTEWRGMNPSSKRIDVALPNGELDASLVALFDATGAPLPLDDVVDAIAVAWRIGEVEHVPVDDIEQQVASVADDAAARDELRRIWTEIGALPLRQRQALLLNLRDDHSASAVELFVFLGIASFDDMAGALEMTPESLATIWNSLPLDDNAIALRTGGTRQQVINSRHAARKRISRTLHNER